MSRVVIDTKPQPNRPSIRVGKQTIHRQLAPARQIIRVRLLQRNPRHSHPRPLNRFRQHNIPRQCRDLIGQPALEIMPRPPVHPHQDVERWHQAGDYELDADTWRGRAWHDGRGWRGGERALDAGHAGLVGFEPRAVELAHFLASNHNTYSINCNTHPAGIEITEAGLAVTTA
jgi:hypothetical protein